MSRPGDRLYVLATRLCSARAVERVLGPAIADLRWEHREAGRQKRSWRAAWIRATASVTVLYLIARHASADAVWIGMRSCAGSPVARVLAGSATVVAVCTALLVAIVMSNAPANLPRHPLLLLYLLPATLPVTVPCGFGLAISWIGAGHGAAARTVPRIAIAAAALSAVMFVTLGWITPTANQAYRVDVGGRQVRKGINELTLPEMQSRLAAGPDVRAVTYTYHSRLALSLAPVALGLFAFAVSHGRRSLRVLGTVLMLGLYLVWYGWMRSPIDTFAGLSPALVAWLPNLTLMSAGSILLRRSGFSA
jgi:hypothetical protein